MKSVTTAQVEHVKKMARAKGVSKDLFQDNFIDGGLCAVAIDAAKSGSRLKVIPPIVAPDGWGGRTHFVEVEVDENQPWSDAVNAAGPNTPDNYDIHKVGDLYLSTDKGRRRKVKMVLVNLANGGDFVKAVAWANQFDLKRTSPRQVFAIGKKFPELHQELGMDPMYVVASEECTFGGYRRVCSVWWGGSDREADLDWVGGVRYSDGWVAFLCE